MAFTFCRLTSVYIFKPKLGLANVLSKRLLGTKKHKRFRCYWCFEKTNQRVDLRVYTGRQEPKENTKHILFNHNKAKSEDIKRFDLVDFDDNLKQLNRI